MARLALHWRGACCEGLCRPDRVGDKDWHAWWSCPGDKVRCPPGFGEPNCDHLTPFLGPAFLPFGTGGLAWCSSRSGGGVEPGRGGLAG
ncbi:hypothetical protein NDU88_001550 [Pleurodeles waltl]|uniref:Uncharacterized protein n=1 Tax=Pleurodeles waltl TaxID=8319 RepID=A0AAV7M3F3_PLEWA|nr:hypothetical protein NDU88_001550 [Pleurodeles waltl]